MNFVLQRQSFAPGAGLHAALVKRYLMAEAGMGKAAGCWSNSMDRRAWPDL